MTDETTDERMPAWVIGARIAGEAAANTAASWAADGNTNTQWIHDTLRMISEGDPGAYDRLLSAPNLSGEYAGDSTPLSLAREITGLDDPPAEVIDALADAWEEGVSETFESACESELRRWLPDPEPIQRFAVAAVFIIEGKDATDAWETFTSELYNLTHDSDVSDAEYVTNPLVLPSADPSDFSIPVVECAGVAMEVADES